MDLGMGLISSLISGGLGLGQLIGGLVKGAKNDRPEMTTPAALTEAVNIARTQAGTSTTPITEQARETVRQNTVDTTTAVQKTGGSVTAQQNAASQIQTQANQAGQNITAQERQDKIRRNENLQAVLGKLANQQLLNQNFNKIQRYQENAQLAAGGVAGGLKTITGTLEGFRQTELLKELMGAQ